MSDTSDRDQSELPVRRLKAEDGIDLSKWSNTQSKLASTHFGRLAPFSSGVMVHSLDRAPTWIRCSYVNDVLDPVKSPHYACGWYPTYLIAVVWDDPKYGDFLYPACRDHLAFVIDDSQRVLDAIAQEMS